jgi:2,4-dienoyl-CoA reductase-like NADH-dependent reductase (Old Yellow Enzyme family)
MEGWDGTTDGQPTEHTIRRWRHFGESGCKLIWGGEAFAVEGDGRANPNQLAVVDGDEDRAARGVAKLLAELIDAHKATFGKTDDLFVGLQLTHSGRFCKPRDKKRLEPRIAYHHPLLDAKFGIAADDDSVLMTDDDLRRLRDRYVAAARLAQKLGFHFVDFKHCHGYFCHELLSGFTRPGPYGGSFENRTRFAREVIAGIQAECPGLIIGVRLSAFDQPPFKPDATRSGDGKLGPGVPEEYQQYLPYRYGFGCNPDNPLEMDLTEPIAFVQMLEQLGVRLINVSAASPYYNPHLSRPAIFPPSDGYQPPEDPLIGVARQIDCVRQLKEACPNSILIGTGYTYLQEYLPHVAQATLRNGWVDSVGIGRLILSYWEMPADALAGRPLHVKRICRTFSDCTTGPRNGLISGCFPLDPHYKDAPEHAELKLKKTEMRKRLSVLK